MTFYRTAGFYRVGDNTHLNPGDHRLIYCNGILSQGEPARKEHASLISKAFNGRAVTVIYQPEQAENEYETDFQLASRLAKEILDQMGSAQYPVAVFAHGHGVHILYQALLQLYFQNIQKLAVYAFEGMVLIPRSIAKEVRHYFREDSLICHHENALHVPGQVVERFLRIRNRMAADQTDLQTSIKNQVKAEILAKFDPLIDKTSLKPLTQFFCDKSSAANVIYDEVKAYTNCFTNHHIKILAKPAERAQETQTKDLDFDAMVESVTEDIFKQVQASDSLRHQFPAFGSAIQKIGRKVAAKEPLDVPQGYLSRECVDTYYPQVVAILTNGEARKGINRLTRTFGVKYYGENITRVNRPTPKFLVDLGNEVCDALGDPHRNFKHVVVSLFEEGYRKLPGETEEVHPVNGFYPHEKIYGVVLEADAEGRLSFTRTGQGDATPSTYTLDEKKGRVFLLEGSGGLRSKPHHYSVSPVSKQRITVTFHI